MEASITALNVWATLTVYETCKIVLAGGEYKNKIVKFANYFLCNFSSIIKGV